MSTASQNLPSTLRSPNTLPNQANPQHSSQAAVPDQQGGMLELLPPHWKLEVPELEKWPLLKLFVEWVLIILCLVSLGHEDLKIVWEETKQGQKDVKVWHEKSERVAARIGTITLTGTLLLSTTAAFLTIEPPGSKLIDHTRPASYICTAASFGLILGAIIVGSAVMCVTAQCTATWFEKTLMRTRSRVVCTLFMISYPFWCLGIATLFTAFGLLIAAWQSFNPVVRYASGLLLVIPVSLVPVFLWTQFDRTKTQTV